MKALSHSPKVPDDRQTPSSQLLGPDGTPPAAPRPGRLVLVLGDGGEHLGSPQEPSRDLGVLLGIRSAVSQGSPGRKLDAGWRKSPRPPLPPWPAEPARSPLTCPCAVSPSQGLHTGCHVLRVDSV